MNKKILQLSLWLTILACAPAPVTPHLQELEVLSQSSKKNAESCLASKEEVLKLHQEMQLIAEATRESAARCDLNAAKIPKTVKVFIQPKAAVEAAPEAHVQATPTPADEWSPSDAPR
jgi:hypothetical protein